MFSAKDKKQIKSKGISDEYLNWQIEKFNSGTLHADLIESASIGNGILRVEYPQNSIAKYEKSTAKATKFVPASGAATRMFKAMFEYKEKFEAAQANGETIPELNAELTTLIDNLSRFPFYAKLQKFAEAEGGLDKLVAEKEYGKILNFFLGKKFLNYGAMPKGLILFHSYDGFSRTAFEEHLVEGALYAKASDGTVNLHFTVSVEHQTGFEALLAKVKGSYEAKYGVKYNVSFSNQKPSTDTMAVNMDNTPFREGDGSILFRPAGHGALIENLNEVDSDLIFIKNIDNIVPEKSIASTVLYKKVIAGVMLDYQEKIFTLIGQLKNGPSTETIQKTIDFINTELNVRVEGENLTANEVIAYLNRPIRVVGVIKNTGEPGGGPFLTKSKAGRISIQIVEEAQVDKSKEDQAAMYANSTHFSPTDIVCGVKNYKGEKFNLKEFVDTDAYFITKKSKSGKDLKALELPGLWNGSMAGWISIYVETPLDTFNPVKIINDLLREAHQ